MKDYHLRGPDHLRHHIKARSVAEARRKVTKLFPLPFHTDVGPPAPPPDHPLPLNEIAKHTEITVTVSGPQRSGKTFFVHRVLRRALALAGLTAINILEDETTVPSFDRLTVRIPVGRLDTIGPVYDDQI
jgi:hypothetical protein